MTRSFPVIAAVVLSIGAAGCSALGLDRFHFPDCASGCSALNDRDRITVDETTCLAWRCDMSSGSCRYGAPDEDQDGHYSIVCEGVAGVSPADDCNDADDQVLPGEPERCNGEDDDCDGLVDDDYATPADPTVVLATTSDPAWLRASDRAEGGVAIAYGVGNDGAGFGIVTNATASVDPGSELAPAAPTDLGRDAFNTNAELEHALGCVSSAFRPSTPWPTCTVSADCPGSAPVCVARTVPPLGSFCEAAISFPGGYPTDDSVCHAHADCDDTSFCNGIPECEPSLSDPGLVDARHCRLAGSRVCTDPERCDEDRRGCTAYSLATCDLAHVAIAPTHEGEWFAPFITQNSCAVGSVRLGYFDDHPGQTDTIRYPQRALLQRGDSRRATAFLGVDVHDDPDGTCTGSTRDAGAPRGASGVVAASVPPSSARHRPEALVAFLAAPFCREHADPNCMPSSPGVTGAVDVEVIGAWFEEGIAGASSSPIAWVNATGDGVPTRLGVQTTATARRPALAEYVSGEDAGWVLAYPRSGGGVSFHVIPAFDDPSPVCVGAGGRPCLESSVAYQTRFDVVTEVDRTTAPLIVPMAQHAFEDAMITGDAALALAPAVDGEVRIGVAWMEESEIAIATATLSVATGTIAADAAVNRFPTDRARDLALVHVPGGLRVEDGAGFVLTWVGGDGTWAARILLDGTVLAPGHVRLGRPAEHPRAFVEMVERDGGLAPLPVVRVLAHQSSQSGFVAFPGVCGAAPLPAP